ncbi:Cyclopropane fatty-acyl-phospholipid synthase [Roseomonas rosea]|uniref:Cyclopropane fatty-acyl-phospholipid synthase n=1 Tax=Muricoccus roseus TaxID=198092 RepID=A0A1M6LRN7_9PROT|nr:class I SAM-dependent methyltransferase [Roseomonas rosea]SHJ73782.1 Cyclopropane fatty-acyl-phospholipid synthase [Roseomonas rosea]
MASLLSSIALRALPPAGRLREAIRDLNAAVARLGAQQEEAGRALGGRLEAQEEALRQLRQQLAHLAAPPPEQPPPEQVPPAVPGPDAGPDAELDRLTARELQRAALRHLPFLLGDVRVTDRAIQIEGLAGAPEGLAANMAFFVNGQRFAHAEYPMLDEQTAARFSEVRGGGLHVRARLGTDTATLSTDGFLRFDASPTGHYLEADWRRALHFVHPQFERFPLPPEDNQRRVVGEANRARFVFGGATLFKNLEFHLRELGLTWGDTPRILDWGCGAGRLARYLIAHSGARVTGVDIDADNIAWCRANLPGGRFETVGLMPPMPFEDGSFDLAVGISVVTHLKEEVQFAWLEELRRVVRPGGLVFLSIQGPVQFAYNGFPPHLFRQIERDGFLDLSVDDALDAVIEDKEYYRSAMQSRAYIVDRWSPYFEVLAIEDATAAIQDFVILRRRTPEEQAEHDAGRTGLMAPPSLRAASAQGAEGETAGAAAYWSLSPEEQAEAVGWYWMAHPAVRARINTLVSGYPDRDAYTRLGEILAGNGMPLPIPRALSLGCGFGGLERDLAARGMLREIDAYDLAEGAIAEARRLAEEAGFGWLRYHVGDLETQDFPEGSYDVVFAHQSVHHIERLDEIFAAIRRALRPGGIFHLNEYVGPNRFQWTDTQIDLVNELLDSLPPRLRRTPSGQKPPQARDTIENMIAVDPTEAIRSAEIREVLARHFEIVEERPYGGTLLHLALGNIAQNFREDSPEDMAHLRRFFELEDRMMAEGRIGSDFTILVARAH